MSALTMKTRIGLLGASSFVANSLIPQLEENYEIATFSRNWSSPPLRADDAALRPIRDWISLIPISALPERLDALYELGARRIVALSSTSVFTKAASSSPAERALSCRIAESESRLAAWAERRGAEWVIIRPTLIYGHGRDRNISEIARFIRRFGFFPIVGAAQGRRQPIHCEDVALACGRALEATHLVNRAYNISGGEVLTYRGMVIRVFEAFDRRPRLVAAPLWLFSGAVACARLFPRWRDWSTPMAERMNQDQVFDHSLAVRDLDLSPRGFRLTARDLPR
jgi:nucleoside-diphosphate-sugar epimerase